jgi:type IV secretory pathway ATPase VirB11/archaellum biosynthesis ATPase
MTFAESQAERARLLRDIAARITAHISEPQVMVETSLDDSMRTIVAKECAAIVGFALEELAAVRK